MNLGYIREAVNYYATKENRGNTITPEQFSLRLRDACIEYANENYKNFQINQSNSDIIGVLEVVKGGMFDPLHIDSDGLAPIPANYYRVSSCAVVLEGELKNVDILSDAEYRERKASYIIDPYEYPSCVIRRNKTAFSTYPYGYIEFNPKVLNFAELTYLSQVPTPYYDYVIGSTTYEEVYMPVGSIITAGNNLVLNSTTLYTGVTHTPTVSLPYTSRSVELVFPEDSHLDIVKVILGFIGINLRDKELIEFNEFLKMKGNAGR